MSFPRFHPIVQRWFTAALGTPMPAQLRGWAGIRDGHHTLIAAPTGSGKTLAGFLSAIDDLTREGLDSGLPDEVRVVYVSPLKALSTDIQKNLAAPRDAICPRISVAVRTGDTPASERAAMIRTPPHILVTTPESLYLLLTSERSRHMLRTARTVIVDEIHAVIGTRRGAHLALSLERLQQIAERPLQRIGLSATQKPIDDVARFLTGGAPCTIVDEGHRRDMDLGIELPRSPLEAVMANEVWEEYYDRLAALIQSHRTTLVFVNTRRMAERVARHLSDRLGADAVAAHHGSLAKETRLEAEKRLKTGSLRAIVATASLELGIDIGHVDLVCQIGSPHRIATLLQRVGRSGHTIAGTPKGRVFPTTRDDLVECAALLRAVRRGELDAIVPHDRALDVLAQQIVAECACREYTEDALFALARRAWPYRDLRRDEFDAVLAMTADGFSTRRGRRAALVHRDEVNRTVRGRRGVRLLALTSGGAIPEIADYRVVLDPGDTFVGTLNEDFAIESQAGDIFQLGNASWRILQVTTGIVRVADAAGTPPTLPFWLGEAPARSDELSRSVSDLRADIDTALQSPTAGNLAELGRVVGLPDDPLTVSQVVSYLAEGRRALGVIPTQETLVLERFFDESGGMQLVLHAPFGSRINKAWALALRKRFCREFNFELQAAATEDALMLSLSAQHSFPLSDVFRYLHPATTREVLVQAFLDAPVFETRWRWNATLSLAVPRSRGGKKVAPQLQRMIAADLLASVFPDAAACLENIPGDREIPDHPLVTQTVRDCLEEAMDFDGLCNVLERIHRGDLRLVARDTPEPSVFACEILAARPYAFLDDAPLEERRSHAVQTRRGTDTADDLGTLDAAAIARVRDEERPDPRDADELHDALMIAGFLTRGETGGYQTILDTLIAMRRATATCVGIVAAERIGELIAIHPSAHLVPHVDPPPSRIRAWTRDAALIEMVRGRLTLTGPTTADALAATLAVDVQDADAALLALEDEGVILRGRFSARSPSPDPRSPIPDPRSPIEWCDRTLLARIHRYTVTRLRAEIEPVSPADFMRFLFKWQHVDAPDRLTGIDGLREVIAMLDGYELAASAWERSVLAARVENYDRSMLDMLCLAGEVAWGRLSPPHGSPGEFPRLVGATPIALFLREHAGAWQAGRPAEESGVHLSEAAKRMLGLLRTRGASFFGDLRTGCELDDDAARSAIGSLVASGLAASDGFAGLRALVWSAAGRPATLDRRANFAGRWTAITTAESRDDYETHAWTLLRRYGVVFRRVLLREAIAPPWRDLARVYRRLEARGEIRGGRFVSGMSGEQFALPRAVERLREVRRTAADGRLLAISAADPLNLAGIITSGDRIRPLPRTGILYQDGVVVDARAADLTRSAYAARLKPRPTRNTLLASDQAVGRPFRGA
jgi:ATP-dependent Lhr-like helicase